MQNLKAIAWSRTRTWSLNSNPIAIMKRRKKNEVVSNPGLSKFNVILNMKWPFYSLHHDFYFHMGFFGLVVCFIKIKSSRYIHRRAAIFHSFVLIQWKGIIAKNNCHFNWLNYHNLHYYFTSLSHHLFWLNKIARPSTSEQITNISISIKCFLTSFNGAFQQHFIFVFLKLMKIVFIVWFEHARSTVLGPSTESWALNRKKNNSVQFFYPAVVGWG